MFRNTTSPTEHTTVARDRKVSRLFHGLIGAALLTAANVRAEDEIVEIDPNNPLIFGVFNDLWNWLMSLAGSPTPVG